MGTHQQAIQRRVAIVATCALLTTSSGPFAYVPPLHAQGAAKPAAQPTPPPDHGWPRSYVTSSGATLILYQPQIASWDNREVMTLYAAMSYARKGDTKPALGMVKATANTKVSVSERLVDFSVLKVTEANFPTLGKEQTHEIVAEITQRIPQQERVIALDRVLASIDKSQIIPKDVQGVKADPPTIFFSETPAVVVSFDSDPVWSPIPENDLKYAVNTNWDLFEDTRGKTFYLRDESWWLKASTVQGPWVAAGKLPESFGRLPANDNWTDVKAAVPGKSLPANAVPKVFVTMKPGELILLTGPPECELVQGTELLWVSNTESDVFRMGKTGSIYYLTSGRWFSAPAFTGPWTFATPTLPPAFKKIPLEHPRSRVLASVPGTPEAAEAVLLAEVPQTARVEKTVKAPEVKYQGEPDFQMIAPTTVSRAVNTDKDILKVGDLYYMCFQGVWFMARSPSGPWEVTGSVPAEIFEIP